MFKSLRKFIRSLINKRKINPNLNKCSNDAKLIEIEMDLLIVSTHFIRAEIEDHYRKFINACPNGKMNKRKFKEIYTRYFPNGRVDKFCKRIFEKQDANANGEIDFIEYITAMSTIIHGSNLLFILIKDIDGNGSIDRHEMKHIIKAIHEISGENKRKNHKKSPSEIVNEMMKILDTNNDGVLSIEEFLNCCNTDTYLSDLLAPAMYQIYL